MKTNYILLILLLSFLFTNCKDEDEPLPELIGAFKQSEYNLSTGETDMEIVISLTRKTNKETPIEIEINNTSTATYGADNDFITEPAAVGNKINTSIPANAEEITIKVIKQKEPPFGETRKVVLKLITIDDPLGKISGNAETNIVFAENPVSNGSQLSANVGGPEHPNQVFIDLSKQAVIDVQRNSWDLGFYAGSDDHKVILNYGNWVSTIQLDKTDINLVNDTDTVGLSSKIIVGSFFPGSDQFVDSPDGSLSKTAMGDISDTEADAKVYIIDRGYNSSRPPLSPRSWMKMKIFKSGDNYTVQYANLNDTDFKTAVINKNQAFNFIFFDLENGKEISVEPEKEKWDFVFTPFPNVLNFGGLITYPYNHFLLTNRHGGVKTYLIDRRVLDDEGEPKKDENENFIIDNSITSYENFKAEEVKSDAFSENRDVIGNTWRDVFSPAHHFDFIYYIIQDTEGNIYKLQFTGFVNENSDAGYPKIEYELL